VECFVTRHARLRGAIQVPDPFAMWDAGDVRALAFALAQSADKIWFGADVSGMTSSQKIEWIENEIRQSRLYVHMRLPRQGGPLDTFRIDFNGRLIYVTTETYIENARPVTDPGWLRQNARVIAVTIASSPETRYFGFDFIQLSHQEKVDWLFDNIVDSGVFNSKVTGRTKPLGIRIFVDDPSDQPGRPSSSSSSSTTGGGNQQTSKK
jgi:hypothetical protein